MVNVAVDQAELGKYEEAIAAGREVVSRFGDSSDHTLRGHVASALASLIAYQTEFGTLSEAIESGKGMVHRFRPNDRPELRSIIGRAHFNMARAYALQSKVRAAISSLEEWAETSDLDCAALSEERTFDPIRNRATFQRFLRKHGCVPA